MTRLRMPPRPFQSVTICSHAGEHLAQSRAHARAVMVLADEQHEHGGNIVERDEGREGHDGDGLEFR